MRSPFSPYSLATLLVVTGCALATASCDEILSGSESEPVAGPHQKAEEVSEAMATTDRAPKVMEEQELKLAKLWARVDELEEEQYRQKERLHIVEKGLTLGLVPEELKHPEKTKGAKGGKKSKTDKVMKGPEGEAAPAVEAEATMESALPLEAGAKGAKEAKPKEEKSANGLSKEENEAYQAALASAYDLYRAGRYGRAIVEYSDIGKRFGDKVDGGMHLYWIAKSWANLKEYNSARQQLLDFLKNHGDSPWAARAKLELGRVEWQLGMQDTALATFRSIIQEHPYADAAEMAKMELENLDKKL